MTSAVVHAAASTSANSLLRGLVVQAEVVYAIILRETRTRFGAQRLGYLWALLEPIIMIATFYGFFRLVDRPTPPGMDAWSFLATGLIPYYLFSSSAQRVAESINGNTALLYYPPVLPIDLAIARGILEAATYSAVFIVLMGAHALYRQELVIDSMPLVLFGFALASALGASVGLVFCCLGQIRNVVDRARGPLLRPLFWVSGVFFTAAMLPEKVQGLLLWNPVLHTTELVRAGVFPTYSDDLANPRYVLAWILGMGFSGLALERIIRRRIEMS